MGKTTRKEGDPIVYRKTIESGLRMWVDAPDEQCRRDIADEYFDNPPERKPPTGECCDNCTHRRTRMIIASDDHSPPSSSSSTTAVQMASTTAAPDAVEVALLDRLDPANWAARTPALRRDNHLKQAQRLLEEWRNRTWLSRYKTQPFGAQGILPDSVLTSLASRTSFRTLEDVRELRWVLAKQHAAKVLKMLEELDREVALEEIAKEQARHDEEVARQMEKEAECERERIRKMIEAAKKLEAKEAEKARKAAEKEAKKKRKAAEKEAEKARKLAEKEAEKARKAVEKEAQKVRKAEEQAAEKARKAAEKAAEKALKKSDKTGGGKRAEGTKRKSLDKGDEPARKRPSSTFHLVHPLALVLSNVRVPPQILL
ncbi:transporter [Ganoderma sinense ZZ0214-1]|uniref:Transporter n=1 Tax=Ganoderma sinense ZZ0214-1 TaxID=1077348 RepID=A0A2G8SJ77_9APHY|nr:transporter [Ganoderma sinense ZZ0214-1]